MRIKKIAIVFCIISLLSFTTHKYYLSLTQIKYKSDSKSLQIITNVFLDDIETALNKDYNINLQLTTEQELENNDVYFEKYLAKKLLFKVNNVAKNFNYIGKEYDGDLVLFYLEIEKVNLPKTITVINNILTTHFDKQQNLIKAKVDNKNKTVLLTKDENSTKLKFE